eukprot:4963889-Pyramimonas_sp.AAC.1
MSHLVTRKFNCPTDSLRTSHVRVEPYQPVMSHRGGTAVLRELTRAAGYVPGAGNRVTRPRPAAIAEISSWKHQDVVPRRRASAPTAGYPATSAGYPADREAFLRQ